MSWFEIGDRAREVWPVLTVAAGFVGLLIGWNFHGRWVRNRVTVRPVSRRLRGDPRSIADAGQEFVGWRVHLGRFVLGERYQHRMDAEAHARKIRGAL